MNWKAMGCTVLLLTSGYTQRISAEHTMVDGLIELEDRLFDARPERSIQVKEFRGAGPLRGKHALRIDNDGIAIFPRVEALYKAPAIGRMSGEGVTSGVPSLDRLLSIGGLPRASATVAIGSTGTGKTTLGMHFLAASTPDEPGLHMGFFEGPDRLRSKADSLGFDIDGLEKSGAVELLWQAPGEFMLDEIASRLLKAVDRRGVKRLVIDGPAGFLESAVYPERINRYFSCVVNELRNRNITILMTLETRDVVSSVVSMPWGVSGLVDNLFFLRFVHDTGRVQRLLTIIKMRDTDHHAELSRMLIDSQGLRIADLVEAEGDVIPKAVPLPAKGAASDEQAE